MAQAAGLEIRPKSGLRFCGYLSQCIFIPDYPLGNVGLFPDLSILLRRVVQRRRLVQE